MCQMPGRPCDCYPNHSRHTLAHTHACILGYVPCDNCLISHMVLRCQRYWGSRLATEPPASAGTMLGGSCSLVRAHRLLYCLHYYPAIQPLYLDQPPPQRLAATYCHPCRHQPREASKPGQLLRSCQTPSRPVAPCTAPSLHVCQHVPAAAAAGCVVGVLTVWQLPAPPHLAGCCFTSAASLQPIGRRLLSATCPAVCACVHAAAATVPLSALLDAGSAASCSHTKPWLAACCSFTGETCGRARQRPRACGREPGTFWPPWAAPHSAPLPSGCAPSPTAR